MGECDEWGVEILPLCLEEYESTMTIFWKYIGYEVLGRIDEVNKKKVPKWRTPNSLKDSKCES